MTDQITIKANDENNPEDFWAALDESYPEIADSVREGETVVDAATWEAIQQLRGFADDPVYALESLVEVEEGGIVDRDGTYEVCAIRAGGYAVVNGETGQVHSEYGDRAEAIKTAEGLNEDGE